MCSIVTSWVPCATCNPQVDVVESHACISNFQLLLDEAVVLGVGETVGETDGEAVGETVADGEAVGETVDETVALGVGESVVLDEILGVVLGVNEGVTLGVGERPTPQHSVCRHLDPAQDLLSGPM
jgi:hypothetical protein